jgi:hypothetical protein
MAERQSNGEVKVSGAGLSWFRVDCDITQHPKTEELCAHLGDPNAGWYVIRLWSWVMRYASEGVLSASRARAMEQICGWRGEAGALLDALLLIGWVDRLEGGAIGIHDWDVHQSAAIKHAAKEAERQRKRRDRIARAARDEPADEPTDEQNGVHGYVQGYEPTDEQGDKQKYEQGDEEEYRGTAQTNKRARVRVQGTQPPKQPATPPVADEPFSPFPKPKKERETPPPAIELTEVKRFTLPTNRLVGERAVAPSVPVELWTGEDFWVHCQADRQNRGAFPERRRPSTLDQWWDDIRRRVTVQDLVSAWARFGADGFWLAKIPPLPFQGFMSQAEERYVIRAPPAPPETPKVACGRCQSEVEKTTEVWGVEICPACHGDWIRSGPADLKSPDEWRAAARSWAVLGKASEAA